ncbi:MAG: hypothetical protein FWE48_01045 [Coriobacteriia bacterium]|nr:hypothetical protein [Coriobacteriia bacterium]
MSNAEIGFMKPDNINRDVPTSHSDAFAVTQDIKEAKPRSDAFSLLSPSFVPNTVPLGSITQKLPICLYGKTMNLELDTSEFQKGLLDFLEFNDEDRDAILHYVKSTRFRDAAAFDNFVFPICGVHGKEEDLDILIINSIDILLSLSSDIAELDAAISALLMTLAGVNASWKLDTAKITARVARVIPRGLFHARVSWILDYPELQKSKRTFSEILTSNEPSLGELYLAEKAASIYASSIFNKLALQEDCAELLCCGAVAESLRKPHALTIDIFAGRNALLGKEKQTLAEIGEESGLTRERVRQIEARATKPFVFNASERLLSWRIAVVSAALMQGGGGCLANLSNELVGLPSFYTNQTFESLLKITPDIMIDESGNGFLLKHLPCVDCEIVKHFADAIIDSESHISIADLADVLGCGEECFGVAPSPDALSIVLRDKHGLTIAGSVIGTRKAAAVWSASRPQSISGQIRAVMCETKRPVSAEEIAGIVSDRMGKTVAKSHVLSFMSRLDSDCLLWDTSTYILRRHAPFPEELLNRIAADIPGVFAKNDIPILGVNGVHDMYAGELRQEGVTSPQALYSLLRIIDDKRLVLREYPWICDAREIGERTSFPKYFLSVVERNNGFISDEHADQIASRAMVQSWQLNGLSIYSPFMMNANGGWHALETMGLDYGVIEQVVNEVAATMQDKELISVKKVFSDHMGLLTRSGVKSFDVLYRAIGLMDGLPLKTSRIPHLVKSSDKRQVSTREAIRTFIKRKGGPCSQEEIFEEFAVKRGIGKNALSPSMFLGDGIFEIDDGVYCADEALELPLEYIDE